MQSVKKVDVAILGGGLAANLLARQLRRTLPDVSIAIFERDEDRSFKVGESSVEIASNFFLRKLGLSTYLYDEQLPKNGLRFFFDTPQKDAELTQMSEVGSDMLPRFPTFQLDRARLEADLMAMNRADGVDVRTGVTVRELDLKQGTEDARAHRHGFVVEAADGAREAWRARWVVDASGRAQLISRKRDLRVHEPHGCGAVWGRFTHVTDMDSLEERAWPGAAAWRARVRHTARVLSTNHFCYRGYWIWFIPIARGVTSLGVVGEVFEPWMRDEEGFWKFLRQHRAVASLIEKAEMIDVGHFARYTYGTKQFWDGAERWAMIGEAAAFSDPFYSPGSDYIAIESDMITDMIRRDLAEGESDAELAERSRLYDEFMRFRYEATMKLYREQYPALGSFETMRLKWNFDISCYYNLWLDFYLRDHHLDLRKVREQLRRKEYVLGALESFRQLMVRMVRELEATGQYHRSNLGQYNDGTDLLYFQDEIGRERKKGAVNTRTEEIFTFCQTEARRILGEGSGASLELTRSMEPVSP